MGNGGTTDRYVWTQTLQEVNMMIRLDPGTRSKSIQCDITPTSLKLKTPTLEIVGEFPKRINSDDSTWTIGMWGVLSD